MATPTLTLPYRTIGSLPINCDVHIPPNAKSFPILIWFHGGGLLQGKRNSASPHMLHGAEKHGYILVSADYRLAPQAGVADILDDVKACMAFVRTELPRHVGDAAVMDVDRLAVSGSSAGGYLAFLAGLYAQPKPKVILPIYPITDPYGEFFTTSQPVPVGKVERETVAPFLDVQGEVVAENETDSKRNMMYFWMMQEASLAQLLHVEKGDGTFIIPEMIKTLGKEALPPTYVVHGDADRFVGVEQADEAVEALRSVGIECEYEKLPGLDHLFDRDEKFTLDDMYAFMKKHV